MSSVNVSYITSFSFPLSLAAGTTYRSSLEGGSLHISSTHVLQWVWQLCGRRRAGQQPLRLWNDCNSELLPGAGSEAAHCNGRFCGWWCISSWKTGQGWCSEVPLFWKALVQPWETHEEDTKPHITSVKCCKFSICRGKCNVCSREKIWLAYLLIDGVYTCTFCIPHYITVRYCCSSVTLGDWIIHCCAWITMSYELF